MAVRKKLCNSPGCQGAISLCGQASYFGGNAGRGGAEEKGRNYKRTAAADKGTADGNIKREVYT